MTGGPLEPGSTIGIIGGGQLGRMLASAAAGLGFRTIVLDPQPDCPAAQTANIQISGSYDDPVALKQLALGADVITYEFENIPVEQVWKLETLRTVRPRAKALEVSQDRLIEKTFLNDLDIATAPFAEITNVADLETALKSFGGKGVLKTRRFGYDGKGQHLFDGTSDTDIAEVLTSLGGAQAILEGFIAFEREISIIAARSIDDEIRAYDPAENVHRSGILHASILPARISDGCAANALDIATKILTALDYVGVLGVEFFVTGDETLLVNEIAPRVHNSGHWTEAACLTSQFEQHVRAIAGWKLGDTKRQADCIMTNLVGDDIEKARELAENPDCKVTVYGKKEIRPGRKMGHVTELRPS